MKKTYDMSAKGGSASGGKKILLITRPIAPPWDEASKNFAYYLAKTLAQFNFLLLTKEVRSDFPEHITQVPIYSSSKLDLGFLQKLKLLKIIPLKNKVDVMHFMLTPNKLNAFAFKTFLQSKSAKTIQTVATLREDLFSDQEFKNILFADKIVTYSDYAKNKLNSLGFENVRRIYPGIDLVKYQLLPKDEKSLETYGISNDDFVIMYNGEYTRLGATDDIVASLPGLFEKIPNAKFVFANRIKTPKDVVKRDEVISTLKEQGILDKVVFTDKFPDIMHMQKMYSLADVIVFPVRNMFGKFDVPLAVIEAMACEKPVVISNLPILQEFASAENSVIIEPGNTEQFVQSLVKLHGDESLRETIGKNARKYVEENFDIQNVAKQYAEVYNQI